MTLCRYRRVAAAALRLHHRLLQARDLHHRVVEVRRVDQPPGHLRPIHPEVTEVDLALADLAEVEADRVDAAIDLILPLRLPLLRQHRHRRTQEVGEVAAKSVYRPLAAHRALHLAQTRRLRNNEVEEAAEIVDPEDRLPCLLES
jgi:hypothetical protein